MKGGLFCSKQYVSLCSVRFFISHINNDIRLEEGRFLNSTSWVALLSRSQVFTVVLFCFGDLDFAVEKTKNFFLWIRLVSVLATFLLSVQNVPWQGFDSRRENNLIFSLSRAHDSAYCCTCRRNITCYDICLCNCSLTFSFTLTT